MSLIICLSDPTTFGHTRMRATSPQHFSVSARVQVLGLSTTFGHKHKHKDSCLGMSTLVFASQPPDRVEMAASRV